MSVGNDLLNVPFPEMVSSLATAIAKSQYNLDRNSIEILKIMGDKEEAPVHIPNYLLKKEGSNEFAFDTVTSGDESVMKTEEIKTSMIGAGFQPTFYQFAETIIEVKMAITLTRETEYESKSKGKKTTVRFGRGRFSVSSTPVDARYSSKYNYNVEGSSLLRTRLVPMPPNSYIQRLLDMKADVLQMEMEKRIKKVELAIELEKAKVNKEIRTLEDKADTEIDKIG